MLKRAYAKIKLPSVLAILISIIALSCYFTAKTAMEDSAIMDELAHIPAGYGYVRYLDYRLNPEHPPLLKALSAIPLLFIKAKFPHNDNLWKNGINEQWYIGNKFLYESGNNAQKIIILSRIAPIIIFALLIVLVYIWSKNLMGDKWALLPAFLIAFSPNFLAHSHYVATDVASTFGILLSVFFFIKFLFNQTKKNMLYAGIAFGIAQAFKFSAVLLLPYFVIIYALFYVTKVIREWNAANSRRFKHFSLTALKYIKNIIIIFAIGYLLVIYPLYLVFTANYPQQKQTNDTIYILTSFAGGPTPEGQICRPLRCLADADIFMTKNPITRPFAQYMLGVLMVMQRATGGNTGYFLGEVSASGWHYYFPIVYLLKEPIPLLIMIFAAIFISIKNAYKKIKTYGSRVKTYFIDYLEINFAEFSMLLFIIFYWSWSLASPLNIGIRHLFPTLPMIYILTAGVLKRWSSKMSIGNAESLAGLIISKIKAVIVSYAKLTFILVLAFWYFAETVYASPYFLSYFNEIGGGVGNGYRYVTDSNYDWGQDLLRLKKFVEEHPEIDKIGVDYFGGGSPKYYLGSKEENWWSSRGNPVNSGIHWLAVSINTLEGATQKLHPGQKRNPEDEYRWLTKLRPPKSGIGRVPEPDYRAGTSIFIYKLR